MTARAHILVLVMIGTVMAILDGTIVNIASKAIMTGLHTDLAGFSWVVTSYMLAFAVVIPLCSWLRDRIGTKRLYLGALAVFTIPPLPKSV